MTGKRRLWRELGFAWLGGVLWGIILLVYLIVSRREVRWWSGYWFFMAWSIATAVLLRSCYRLLSRGPFLLLPVAIGFPLWLLLMVAAQQAPSDLTQGRGLWEWGNMGQPQLALSGPVDGENVLTTIIGASSVWMGYLVSRFGGTVPALIFGHALLYLTLVGLTMVLAALGWQCVAIVLTAARAYVVGNRWWRQFRRVLLVVLLVVAVADVLGVVLGSVPLRADWEAVPTAGLPTGPTHSVTALGVGPAGYLYAGTSVGGLFRSDDHGAAWQPANQGLPATQINALATGAGGSSLFVGTAGGGVFRSDDEGESWRPVNEGLANLSVYGLSLGSGGQRLFAATAGGVFRLEDPGENWRLASQGLTNLDIRALVVGPEGNGLFAGTWGGGVFRSDDDGENWRSVSQAPLYPWISALAVGSEGRSLYAATSGWGVFRSDDQGENWHPVTQGLVSGSVSCLAAGPGGQGLYAGIAGSGVFRFDDQEETWEPANQGLTYLDVYALAGEPGGRYLFVAITSGGVFRSDDKGAYWQSANQGLTSLNVEKVVVGPGGRSLFAGSWGGGVFRSDDRGETWRPLNRGLTNTFVGALALGPGGRSLYAGTNDGNVFRSGDEGQTWRASVQPPTRQGITALLVGPGGRRLFAGSWGDGVFRSDDEGQTWPKANQRLPGTQVTALVLGTGGRLFAATRAGVYRSDDEGESWPPASQGLSSLWVDSLSVGPGGRGLFAGVYDGVYRSDDESESWRLVKEGQNGANVTSLATGPGGRSLYAGTSADGLYRSDDGGEHWRPASQGLTGLHVRALATGPGDQGLYVATTTAGIFRSDDGETWRPVNRGLASFAMSSLWVDPRTHTLFVQVPGHGSYRSDDRGASWRASMDEAGPWAPNPQSLSLSRTLLLLPWARTSCGPVGAMVVDGDRAELYILSGSAMVLRTVVATPLLWRAPAPYLTLVATTWRAMDGVRANAENLALAVGILVCAAALYLYLGIVRPNGLRPASYLWLLPRPRYWVAAAAYGSYARRANSLAPLEKLVALEAPLTPFGADQIQASLLQKRVPAQGNLVHDVLARLAQKGFLAHQQQRWLLAKPYVALLQRREWSSQQRDELVDLARGEHPLWSETLDFITAAGFQPEPVGPLGWRCTSERPEWSAIVPLYVHAVLGQQLDVNAFTELCDAATEALGGSLERRVALVVIDRAPKAADLHQIFAIRANQWFTIVPLPKSLIVQAQVDHREGLVVQEQLERYTGKEDFYQSSGAVSDVLSFFGRQAQLASLDAQLRHGGRVLLYGIRKIGKSSLLHRLTENTEWPTSLIDLEGYAGGLDYVYSNILDGWRTSVRARYPDLAASAWNRPIEPLRPGAEVELFRGAVLALLDTLRSQPGQPGLLLCLDEIEYLYDQPHYLSFAGVLRSIAEHPQCRGRFAILATGLDPALNRTDRMNEQRNPLYQFFTEQPLGPLDEEATRTMVVSIGGQMAISYREEALALLCDLGGGHPLLTRHLCSQAIIGIDKPGVVETDRAALAVEAYLRSPDSYLANSLWHIEGGGPPPAEAELLQALARRQPQTETELISRALPDDERWASRRALQRLTDMSVLCSTPEGLVHTFPLYRLWVRREILGLEDRPEEVL